MVVTDVSCIAPKDLYSCGELCSPSPSPPCVCLSRARVRTASAILAQARRSDAGTLTRSYPCMALHMVRMYLADHCVAVHQETRFCILSSSFPCQPCQHRQKRLTPIARLIHSFVEDVFLSCIRPPLWTHGDDLHPDVSQRPDDAEEMPKRPGRYHLDNCQSRASLHWVSEEGMRCLRVE